MRLNTPHGLALGSAIIHTYGSWSEVRKHGYYTPDGVFVIQHPPELVDEFRSNYEAVCRARGLNPHPERKKPNPLVRLWGWVLTGKY